MSDERRTTEAEVLDINIAFGWFAEYWSMGHVDAATKWGSVAVAIVEATDPDWQDHGWPAPPPWRRGQRGRRG